MRAACIHAASAAIGRQLTEAEANKIEERLGASMRKLARDDPQGWQAKPTAERVREAASDAAIGLVAEKQLAQQRQALTILATGRILQHIRESKARGMTGFDALDRLIAFKADRKANVLSMESQARAIERDAERQMIGTLEASNPKFFGLIANKEGEQAIVRELFGESTGIPEARKGAEEFHKVTSALRERFNRAGGDVGQLEDWGLPHHHSQMKVAKAGREAWIADVLPILKREAYVNEDGSRMSEPQLDSFLSHAWETIATNGANKVDPGQFKGGGARENRGNASRQIHFKDAQSYIDYQAKYAERSLYEVMVGHVAGVSKDIAMVETMGPNPDHMFRYVRDALVIDAKHADQTKLGKIEAEARRVESLYNVVSGKTQPVASEHLARTFDTLRNWMGASRLGSSFITSFSDDATMHLTAHVNNLPEMRLIANELAALNPANKMEERMALRAGLSMNTMLSYLNRFGQDGLGSSFSSKLLNTTLRVSGLNAITEARRRAFGVTYMHALGAIVRDHADLAAIDKDDHAILLSKGITPTDFAVWKKAELEDWGSGNNTMLTPEAIYRIPDASLQELGDPKVLKEQAATRLLGATLEETDVAVIEPGARERAQVGEGVQRGTIKGELLRSFYQFKSFPLAMIEKHWQRGMSYPNKGGRAAYLATLLAATTILGMVSLQVDQVLQGKDPRNLNPAKKGGVRNWIAAMLKGGSLGIYGDFLFSDSTSGGNSPLASLAGPVAGMAEDFFKLTQGSIMKASQGKRTNFGAELVRFIRGNTPGASIWYAKGALDHLIFHRLQEYFSPGYLGTLRNRAEREFGQRYWWEPG
jgi:hypothetical protein